MKEKEKQSDIPSTWHSKNSTLLACFQAPPSLPPFFKKKITLILGILQLPKFYFLYFKQPYVSLLSLPCSNICSGRRCTTTPSVPAVLYAVAAHSYQGHEKWYHKYLQCAFSPFLQEVLRENYSQRGGGEKKLNSCIDWFPPQPFKNKILMMQNELRFCSVFIFGVQLSCTQRGLSRYIKYKFSYNL